MSALSSGGGITQASKGGAGHGQSVCLRAFLLDKTDGRREETQKDTVQQDARLKGTQRGTRVGMAYAGALTSVCTRIQKPGGRHTQSEWGQPHPVTCTVRSTSRRLKAQDTQDSSAPDSSPGCSQHPKPTVEPRSNSFGLVSPTICGHCSARGRNKPRESGHQFA